MRDVACRLFYVLRHSLAPVSVAVFADRVFYTDLHCKDVLFHRKADKDSRETISVDVSPLTAIVAVDMNSQLPGLYHSLATPSHFS